LKKFYSVLVCIAFLLSLACCAKPTQEYAPPALTEEQALRLEGLFNEALEEYDFDWGDTPRHIPAIFADNEDFRFKVGIDPETNVKGLNMDLSSREFGNFSIGDYQFRNNFCSMFYGPNELPDLYRDSSQFKRYEANGMEWYFSTYYVEGYMLHVLIRYDVDENITCNIMVDFPNETELTDELAQKMIADFTCVSF